MPRERFQRKDLKRPDEFVTEGLHALAWARQNSGLLTGIGVVAAVIAAALIGVSAVREARLSQAGDELGEALADFQTKSFAEAAPKLADVGARWETTTPGRLARLFAADAQIHTSNYDGATTLLQPLPTDSSWPSYLAQHAALALASATEAKGDYAAAAARFSVASGLEGPYTAIAIFGEARCRELAGEKELASKLYQRLTREFPQSPENEVATAKIEALNG